VTATGTPGSVPTLRPPVPGQVSRPPAEADRPGQPTGADPTTTGRDAGLRSAQPATGVALDDLVGALRPAIARAPTADPDEVAAALEDAGLTDQAARQTFGQPDLFALAGRLLPRLARSAPTRPRRHAVPPMRLDWSGLLRPRLATPRLIAAAGLAAAWWLRLPAPAIVPAAAAVPLAELLLAWHLGYARWGLGYHDSGTGWRRHLRRTGLLTLAALAVPLVVAAGLAGAATHRTGLVPVASGLLAAGGYPLLLLLTARRRLLTGASLIAVIAAGTALTHPSLPRMGLLAGGYLAGLALVAYAILDPRSRD
jgi:hypothetical protein